jgi:hypothetical protein
MGNLNMYYSYYGLNSLSNTIKKYNQEDLQKQAEDLLKEVKGAMN